MKIIHRIDELPLRTRFRGFVPTMGAFHEGHLDLMRAARKECEEVVVSLFVNPTQFGPAEDFNRYPRDLERDAAMAEKVGVDLLFAPSPDEIYPRKTTSINVHEVSDRWEGASRPGHFSGVATVVCKLFNIVNPNRAYFGWKDIQQCLVIKRMVEDLNFSLELSFQETTREPDGLAMSSRNAYLSSDNRAVAPQIYSALCALRTSANEGILKINQAIELEKSRLSALGFEIDYLTIVDLDTLAPVDSWRSNLVAIVAAKLGNTRLIDNLRF